MEVIIPQIIHDKVMHWVNKADKEVSGFGTIVRDGGKFEVKEVYLLDQEVGSAHTDIDEKSLAKLMYQTKDDEGDLKWWWHSHVNMDVFWSSVDKDTIKELGTQGWIVASVFNKKEEIRSAVCYKYKYESALGAGEDVALIDDVDTTIALVVDTDEVDKWDKEFKDKVREQKVVSMHGYEYGGAVEAGWNREWQYNPDTGAYAKKSDSVLDYDRDPGLLHYGVKAEAEALGMTVKVYTDKLAKCDLKEIYALEDRLMILENQGKIRGVPYEYNNAKA